MTRLLVSLTVTGILAGAAVAQAPDTKPAAGRQEAASVKSAPWPFFPFCMDTHDSMKRTLPQQADLLKELGYDGVGHLWLDNVAERIQTLDAAGLKLFKITLKMDLTPGAQPYDPRLKDVLPLLKDRNVMFLALIGGFKPRDPAGESRAIEVVSEMADAAKPFGVRVVLYPHTGDWLDRIGQAVALAKKINRPNVGVIFNLCHWMKADDTTDLEPVLREAMPYLFAVSIHGSDTVESVRAGAGNWIQPLGSGSFDMLSFLKTLKKAGYQGPVGLQCWGIPGDARDHLAKSIAAWRALQDQLNAP